MAVWERSGFPGNSKALVSLVAAGKSLDQEVVVPQLQIGMSHGWLDLVTVAGEMDWAAGASNSTEDPRLNPVGTKVAAKSCSAEGAACVRETWNPWW